jgi:hypothetical protein
MPVDIALPSGATVAVRDNDTPGDHWAVSDAPDVTNEDGVVSVRNASGNMWKTFMARVVVGWSYGVPFQEGNLSLFDAAWPGDMDDFMALRDALQERFDRVARSRRSPNSQSRPSPTNGTSSSS